MARATSTIRRASLTSDDDDDDDDDSDSTPDTVHSLPVPPPRSARLLFPRHDTGPYTYTYAQQSPVHPIASPDLFYEFPSPHRQRFESALPTFGLYKCSELIPLCSYFLPCCLGTARPLDPNGAASIMLMGPFTASNLSTAHKPIR